MELARAGGKCLLWSCFPGLCYLDKANVKLLAVQQCSTGCFFWFKLGTGLLFEMVSVSWRQICKSHSVCRSPASPNPSFLPGQPVTWRAVSPISFPDSGHGSPFRIKPFQCDWNVLKDLNVVFVEFWFRPCLSLPVNLSQWHSDTSSQRMFGVEQCDKLASLSTYMHWKVQWSLGTGRRGKVELRSKGRTRQCWEGEVFICQF